MRSNRISYALGLSVAALASVAPASAATTTFSGNVPTDFTGAGIITIVDPSGVDIGVPGNFGTVSGFDMQDFRLNYDAATDTLYVGINTYGIAGDADGDGIPGGSSAALLGNGGVDLPDFGGTESFAFLIDVDEDGIFDVVAGVSGVTDMAGFSVSRFAGVPFAPAFGFGAPLPANTGAVFGSPSAAAPDLEFTITSFSTLPTSSGHDASLSFGVNAFLGSFSDDGIGEDFNPGTNVAVQVCFDSDGDGVTTCAGDCDDANPGVHPGASETCDGLDNDCNGPVDDGNPGGGQACASGQPGVCSPGTTACEAGAIVCNPNAQPSPEACDSLDNDCDGAVDDGNPGGGQACASGQPGICGPGTTSCAGGVVVCNQNQQPAAELCDGLDNDCDGAVDEGNPGGGQACSTGNPGICGPGTSACSGGAIVCNQNQQPSVEVCDGLDNDCNGAVDNGNPGGGAACSTGMLGLCAAGTSACSAGSVVCNANSSPHAEICDGIDNDCDGSVDEGFDNDHDNIPDCIDPEVCGNGVVEGIETCDDGNTVDGDSCPSNCYTPSSGVGVMGADPHFVTRDGLFYDFQASGDFLISTTGPSYIVQCRLENDPGTKLFSWITATAMQVGPDRVSIFVPGRYASTVWLNNQPITLVDGINTHLAGGGTIKKSGLYTYVTWATGEQVKMKIASTFMNVTIIKGITGSSGGMIGNFDGNLNNNFVTRSGTILPPPLTFAQLYTTFGDSWRVTAAENLFHYPSPPATNPPQPPMPGAPQAQAEQPAFGTNPAKAFYAEDLDKAEMDAAMSICMHANVTHPALIDACVLDVAGADTDADKIAIAEEYGQMPAPAAVMRTDGLTASFIPFGNAGQGGASASEPTAGGAACSVGAPGEGGSSNTGLFLLCAAACLAGLGTRRRSAGRA